MIYELFQFPFLVDQIIGCILFLSLSLGQKRPWLLLPGSLPPPSAGRAHSGPCCLPRRSPWGASFGGLLPRPLCGASLGGSHNRPRPPLPFPLPLRPPLPLFSSAGVSPSLQFLTASACPLSLCPQFLEPSTFLSQWWSLPPPPPLLPNAHRTKSPILLTGTSSTCAFSFRFLSSVSRTEVR